MIQSFAKKREAIRAVRWTGEVTPEMKELLGERAGKVEGDRQLVFSNEQGPGRFACAGDWICSTSGEDLFVVGNEVFRDTYEEVDETGRSLPPTDAEHEAAALDLMREIDVLLVEGLKLSREDHSGIFRDRERIMRTLRHLFEDQAYTAARRERQRIKDRIVKELAP